MSTHRVLVSLQHDPKVGHRPAFDGLGVGPWLDETSARFLVEWLALSKSSVHETLSRLRVETTFEEAIGLRRPAPALPAPTPPGALEVPC